MHEYILEPTNPFLAGGLGGTIRQSTEGDRQNTYEGIDLRSSDICRREVTVKRLADKLWAAGVLLVRSPPMAGKTSLAQLLEQHFLKDSTFRVIRISLLWMGPAGGAWTFEEEFRRLMGGTSWKELIQPLDRGTYDVFQLLRLLRKMKYTGPIGLQHYGIGGDARENLEHSMEGWKRLSGAK